MFADEMRKLANNTELTETQLREIVNKYKIDFIKAVDGYVENSVKNIKETLKEKITKNQYEEKGLFSKKKLVSTAWSIQGAWDYRIVFVLKQEVDKINKDYQIALSHLPKREQKEFQKFLDSYTDSLLAQKIVEILNSEGLEAKQESCSGEGKDYFYPVVKVKLYL